MLRREARGTACRPVVSPGKVVRLNMEKCEEGVDCDGITGQKMSVNIEQNESDC